MKNDDENRHDPDPEPDASEGEDDRSRASTEVIDLTELQSHLDLCREDGAQAEPRSGDEAGGALDLRKVPVMATAPDKIRWHRLDHRAGFLLSRVDGKRTYAAIIELSGLKHTDAVELLLELHAAKIITHHGDDK